MDERLAKTIAAIKACGADWGLLTSPEGVAYATGHIVPIEAGPSPFAGGPCLAIVGTGGQCGLVITNLEEGTAAWADPIVTYQGFSYQQPTDIHANYKEATDRLAKDMRLGGIIAIEEQSFPLSLYPLVDGRERRPLDLSLKRERAIKTPAEIALLRRAAQVASIGQRAFLEAARAERSELEIFADIRLAMESAAGERLPVTGDLITGMERTSAFMGWPGNRKLEAGDPLICDLAPRVAGYWGDSCASSMLGDSSPGYRKLYTAAKTALDRAIETVRPGVVIADLDRLLQDHVRRHGYHYAHHSGHSIGTGVHEWPRIVSYEMESLRKDMIIMVEPTAFDPDVGGVRLEFMLQVTDGGCEVLTDFEHQMKI